MAEIKFGNRPGAAGAADKQSGAAAELAASISDCRKAFDSIGAAANAVIESFKSFPEKLTAGASAGPTDYFSAGQSGIQFNAAIGNETVPFQSGISAIGDHLASLNGGSDYIIDFYGRGSDEMPISEKIQSIQDDLENAFAEPVTQNIDFQISAGRGGKRGSRGGGISSGASEVRSLISGYVEAMSNLAFDRSVGASDDWSQYGASAYQAQVTAYQRLLGIGGTGFTATGGASAAPAGGASVVIENVTINGVNTDDPLDLADKFDAAISDKIKRGTSEIPQALKAAGI